MRVLLIEDNVSKYCNVNRAVKRLGIKDIVDAENLEEAVNILKTDSDKIDLIITDMSYPLNSHDSENGKAGEMLMRYVKDNEYDIPVIVCSSVRYDYPEAYGTIWYNLNARDIDKDMRELVEPLMNKK